MREGYRFEIQGFKILFFTNNRRLQKRFFLKKNDWCMSPGAAKISRLGRERQRQNALKS